jgi:hypothetical protein
VSYVDAGYVIGLAVLALYAVALVLRRRRLQRAAAAASGPVAGGPPVPPPGVHAAPLPATGSDGRQPYPPASGRSNAAPGHP